MILGFARSASHPPHPNKNQMSSLIKMATMNLMKTLMKMTTDWWRRHQYFCLYSCST